MNWKSKMKLKQQNCLNLISLHKGAGASFAVGQV